MSRASRPEGRVSLVGAGPGASGLFTLAGRRALERADVVLYDHLASSALLTSVTVEGQERIHVGKRAEKGFAAQNDINDLMLRRAEAGQWVVRLKGGDPFIFGRGGEEAQVCAQAGIDFEVIPGVSAVNAALAAAGIPLTHRELASSFTVVTGHEREEREREALDWRALAKTRGTLVVLMGVRYVTRWTQELIAGGMCKDTPVAFIRWGTTPRQETLVGSLSTIASQVLEEGFEAPAIAVLGEVVHLRDELTWFERRPLFGQVVALTRSASKDTQDFEPLEDLGATVLHVPLTHQVPIEGGGELVEALKAARFNELIVTSANGVKALDSALERAGKDARDLKGVRTWCVGPATARALRRIIGVRADEIPAEASAAGLVAHAGRLGVAGQHFLYPAAAAARRELSEGLTALGATIDEIASYETKSLPSGPTNLQSALEMGLSLVALASPSAVRAFAKAMDSLGVERDAVHVAAIGPTTSQAAQAAGLCVRVEAETHTMPGLAAAIAAGVAATK